MQDIDKKTTNDLPSLHAPSYDSARKIRKARHHGWKSWKSPLPALAFALPLFIGSPVAFFYSYYEAEGFFYTYLCTFLMLVILGLNEWTSFFRPSSRRRGEWNRRHFTSMEIGAFVVLAILGLLILIRRWTIVSSW